tara:strand:- start:7064 stop:7243 length:180 start_codon:yes stop_codon:yes gene_type:complete
MEESEYNKIEMEILKEMESLLASETNTSNLKEIQSLRVKLRKLRLDNLDKSNIDNLNTI